MWHVGTITTNATRILSVYSAFSILLSCSGAFPAAHATSPLHLSQVQELHHGICANTTRCWELYFFALFLLSVSQNWSWHNLQGASSFQKLWRCVVEIESQQGEHDSHVHQCTVLCNSAQELTENLKVLIKKVKLKKIRLKLFNQYEQMYSLWRGT